MNILGYDFVTVGCATNKITGEKYVFQTAYDDMEKRIRKDYNTAKHLINKGEQIDDFRANLYKYGKENFEYTILEKYVPESDKYEAVGKWIDRLDTYNNGLNTSISDKTGYLRISKEQINEILNSYNNGENINHIYRKMDMDRKTVVSVLKKNHVYPSSEIKLISPPFEIR